MSYRGGYSNASTTTGSAEAKPGIWVAAVWRYIAAHEENMVVKVHCVDAHVPELYH